MKRGLSRSLSTRDDSTTPSNLVVGSALLETGSELAAGAGASDMMFSSAEAPLRAPLGADDELDEDPELGPAPAQPDPPRSPSAARKLWKTDRHSRSPAPVQYLTEQDLIPQSPRDEEDAPSCWFCGITAGCFREDAKPASDADEYWTLSSLLTTDTPPTR